VGEDSQPHPKRDLLVALGYLLLTLLLVAMLLHEFATYGTHWDALVPGKLTLPWGVVLASGIGVILLLGGGVTAHVVLAVRGFRELRSGAPDGPQRNVR
jgi:hypothetical protein